MKIKIGDLFNSSAFTLVNTVNCVGVMGKGIALEFKKRYPLMYEDYVERCRQKRVKPGCPYYFHKDDISIINFPTKNHWRSPSKLSYIQQGIKWFRENYQQLGIQSIAFPPLGCGNGGLKWSVVGPIMYHDLKNLPIAIEIYAPFGTPKEQLSEAYLMRSYSEGQQNITGDRGVAFNKNWLFIPYLVKRLNNDQYALNVGRIIFQKICFLLEREGISMGLHFIKGTYGPYSREVDEVRSALANANLIKERELGKMIETVVEPDFQLDITNYSQQEMKIVNKVYDLMCRMHNTDQAEVDSTVLFAYDDLKKKNSSVSEEEVLKDVLEWKPRWKGEKEEEVITAIQSLAMLGWIETASDRGILPDAEAFLYG